jgi:Fe-S-cluster-containing dehydrogenase component
VQYGFLMDHRRCIGCHACTVACKAENGVPVGSFRTWVKYTEAGVFPAVKRHFSILRCNHCTKAPCVTICPVNALEKRTDGIVDIDRDACIGCRACMQGCPYDAIYLNEDLGAVEKCHYCAHRVERNLEPACVIVCPEQAIVAGDLHDPNSKISRMLAEHGTLVRRPEQGTGPNVHYLATHPVALEPGRASTPPTYLWSERPATKPEPWPEQLALEPNVRTVLDVGHKVQWGWPVALYLVTKGVAAGAALFAPFAPNLGLAGFARDYLPEILALGFTGITTFLLVEDLHRPWKFLTLLTRPNTRSWLVKGAWILMAFAGLLAAALATRWLGHAALADGLRWVNAALALGAAGYTAFLFRQCEGRDLWQDRQLLPHLIVQAGTCGAAALLPFAASPKDLGQLLGAGLVAHGVFVAREAKKHHATANARQAVAFLTVARLGRFTRPYRLGTRAGIALPMGLVALAGLGSLAPAAPALLLAASLTALTGLFLYKAAYVRAGQLPPLS